MFRVRHETAEDAPSVRRFNELAFGRPEEAALVDALRAASVPHLSLVAVEGGRVVGHIFFSPVSIESEGRTFQALGLAPMAVAASTQSPTRRSWWRSSPYGGSAPVRAAPDSTRCGRHRRQSYESY